MKPGKPLFRNYYNDNWEMMFYKFYGIISYNLFVENWLWKILPFVLQLLGGRIFVRFSVRFRKTLWKSKKNESPFQFGKSFLKSLAVENIGQEGKKNSVKLGKDVL